MSDNATLVERLREDAEHERSQSENADDYRAALFDEAAARIAELEAAVDEIAMQHTLAEDEAKWNSERDGEEWMPDVETSYDVLIGIARRVSRASRARPAP